MARFERRFIRVCAVLGVVLLLLATGSSKPASGVTPHTALAGTTYYVAPDGRDSNPGTEAQPWRTIQQAANTLRAGDTVYIKAGTYAEQVHPQHSGITGHYIIYAAYPGDDVIIDGEGIALPEYTGLFYVSGQSYIKISGLHIINSDREGILVDGASYIIIENNHTINTAISGIGVWGSDHITLDGNTVERACHGGYQECITVAGTATFEVKNNEVFDCAKEGIDSKDGSSNGQVYRNHVHHTQAVGIYVDAWDKHTFNIEIFQNIVHDSINANGITLASETGGLLENVRVYNNISYNNRTYGLELSRCCDAPTHPVHNIEIFNNTFYHNGLDPWGGGIAVDNPDAENVRVQNNIVSQNLSFQMVVSPDVPPEQVIVDHNLTDGYRGMEGETYGESSVEGAPLFVNPEAGDFSLRSGSPAVDNGIEIEGLSEDIAGNHRPQDGDDDGIVDYDMGAFELE